MEWKCSFLIGDIEADRLSNFNNLIEFLKEFPSVDSSPLDYTKLKSIYLSYFLTHKDVHHRGRCTYSTKEHRYYLIRCSIKYNQAYPYKLVDYIRPEFRDMPTGGKLVLKRNDSEIINDKEEDMAYVFGHELFHYLRKTRQVPGRNTQAQANEFGFSFLRNFKNWKKETVKDEYRECRRSAGLLD